MPRLVLQPKHRVSEGSDRVIKRRRRNVSKSHMARLYKPLVYPVICSAHLASIRHSSSLPALCGGQTEIQRAYGIGKVTIENAAPVDVIQDVENVITGMLQSPKLDIRSFWFSATA